MKFLYDRRVVALLRIFLGLLFVAAALPKLQDPEAFAKSVSNYRLLAETPGRILALVLPPLELLIGVFLIVGIFDAGASAISFALMVTFTLAVGIALGRGLDISCGCFETEGGSKVGMKKIVENLLLVAAAWIVHRGDRSWLSLGAWTRSRRMATAAGIALVSIATAHIAQAQQSATPKTTPAVKPAPSKRALPHERSSGRGPDASIPLVDRSQPAAARVSLWNDSFAGSARIAASGNRGGSVSGKRCVCERDSAHRRDEQGDRRRIGAQRWGNAGDDSSTRRA
jgi:hypothetical protein